MSRDELVGAYLDGRMSRRTLVRRLAAGGVSVGAAIAYAQLLDPKRASARLLGSYHFDASVKIIEEDLDEVVAEKGLRVRITTDREMFMRAEVYLLRSRNATPFPRSRVGYAGFDFPAAGTMTKRIRFRENPPYSQIAVREERNRRGRARFSVVVVGFSDGGLDKFRVQRTLSS